MMSLILTIAMIPAAPAAQTAQVQTCVWPHVCTENAPLLPVLTAQVQTCVWPHVCTETSKA